MKARYPSLCGICCRDIAAGVTIRKTAAGWAHDECAVADAEFTRNRERVLSGDTYASQAPSQWRRGRSPGSSRSRTT